MLAAVVAIVSAALLLDAADRPSPKLILWTWDRPEDLRFLGGDDVAVVYLAGTIRLRNERIELRPRFSPLALRDSTPRRPVVRIETDLFDRPALDALQRAAVVARIESLVGLGSLDSLQIDFDAPRSARDFYRALLADLRARLPRGAELTMTALASWCLGDRWLESVEVDDVVPMFFRMGRDDGVVRAALARNEELAPECRRSAGIALDEPSLDYGEAGNLYVFSARSWTSADYEALRARLDGPRS